MAMLPAAIPAMAPRLSFCVDRDDDGCTVSGGLSFTHGVLAGFVQMALEESDGGGPDVVDCPLVEGIAADNVCDIDPAVDDVLFDGEAGDDDRDTVWVGVECDTCVVVATVRIVVVHAHIVVVVVVIVVVLAFLSFISGPPRPRSREKTESPRTGVGVASMPTTRKDRKAATNAMD